MDGVSSPCRLSLESMYGDVWLYVREDIPSNLLSIEMKPIKGFKRLVKSAKQEILHKLFLQAS